MKPLSKPLSSPSRTEKFPPPLMRFLRSNVSSRSRGRSRLGPMFLRKKNAAAVSIETTQEPSSPKVTCIGQVRVRRSSISRKPSNSSAAASSKPQRTNSSTTSLSKQTPCWWVRRALFCHQFLPRFHKPRSKPLFRKWTLIFRFGYCKKVDTRDDFSSRVESIPRIHNNNSSDAASDVENNDYVGCTMMIEAAQVEEIKEGLLGTISSTPPKNALLLTRCRSAPYRSSSLASRFWGSPVKGDGDNGEEKLGRVEEEGERERPMSPICRNEVAEPRFSSQSEEMEGSVINVITGEAKSIQDFRAVGGAAVHPLLLTRCKSEPARTGERLVVNTEAINFCKQRRVEVSEPCSQH